MLRVEDDFVFDTIRIFEKHRIIPGRRVLRIVLRRAYNRCAYFQQLLVKFVDVLSRCGLKSEVVQCPRFSAIDCVIRECFSG